MNIAVPLDMTPCRLVVSPMKVIIYITCTKFNGIGFPLRMEEDTFFETWMTSYQSVQRHIPDDPSGYFLRPLS
jgi:hypothetical protein